MNKIAKILSAVIAVVMALSMITFAFAAEKAAVSLNLVSEDANTVTVSVVLDKGDKIGAIEVAVTAKTGNIGALTDIKSGDFEMNMPNKANGMMAVLSTEGLGAGAVVAEYTFAKTASDNVNVEDFDIAVTNCANVDLETLECSVVNKLPAKPVVTEPSTEKTEPSTEKTEPSTEKTEPSTEATEPSTEATEPSTEATEPSTEATEPSTEATEPSTEATEPSTEATEPSTEATEPSTEATEPSTEATEPSTEATDAPAEDKTDAPAADDKTEAPSTGDVVNPDTGDSATATAAILSLLAVSGAALVALRKKED